MKQGWEYKKLGEVCEVVSGSTPKTNVPEYWGKGHYWVTPAELNETIVYIDKTERQITDEALAKTKLRLLPVGTVLLSSRAPIGKVAITKTEMYCNQGFKNCICSDSIYNKYLFYFLRLKKEYLNSLGRGATFKEISKSIVESIPIPLPPKSTQLAIVSELDKINELIRLKKEQLKDFDNLAQSIFYEMFGDPVENEMGWEVKKLGDSIKVIGGYAFCSKNFLKSGIPVLRIGNINTGKFTPTNMVYWQKDEELSRYRILPGDLVISLTGTVGKSDYGNVCILGNDYEEYYLNQRNAKLEVGSNLNKYFLTYLLKQDMIRKKLTGINRGVRQANIANRDIENLNIPLPPLPLQHLFAHRIEQIEHQKVEVQKTIADLETLLASRMQYWFE